MRLPIGGALTAMAVAAAPLLGCGEPYALKTSSINYDAPQRPALIQVSDPQLYRRESLVNDRYQEVAYLQKLRDKSETQEFGSDLARELEVIAAFSAQLGLSFDPAKGLQFDRAKERSDIEQQIVVTKLEAELAQVRRDLALLETKLLSQTEPSGAIGGNTTQVKDPTFEAPKLEDALKIADRLKGLIDNVAGRIDAKSTEPRATSAKASPRDVFRDRQALRGDIRAALQAAELDDLHDKDGNSLFRFQFRATVLPGQTLDQAGVLRVTVQPPQLPPDRIVRLYQEWLAYIAGRLNPTDASAQARNAAERLTWLDFGTDLFNLAKLPFTGEGQPAKIDDQTRTACVTGDQTQCIVVSLPLAEGYDQLYKLMLSDTGLAVFRPSDAARPLATPSGSATLNLPFGNLLKALVTHAVTLAKASQDTSQKPVLPVETLSLGNCGLENLATPFRHSDLYRNKLKPVIDHAEAAAPAPNAASAAGANPTPANPTSTPNQSPAAGQPPAPPPAGQPAPPIVAGGTPPDLSKLSDTEKLEFALHLTLAYRMLIAATTGVQSDRLLKGIGRQEYVTAIGQLANAADTAETFIRRYIESQNFKTAHPDCAGRERFAAVRAIAELNQIPRKFGEALFSTRKDYVPYEIDRPTPETFLGRIFAEKKETRLAVANRYMLDGRIAAYATSPAELAQRVSSVARAGEALQLAASIAATLPAKGVGGNAALGYARSAMGKVDALERVPLVVGFSEAGRNATRDEYGAKPASARFGWVLGPKMVLDASTQELKLEQGIASYDLTADLSLPGWWPDVEMVIETAWAQNWRSPHATEPSVFTENAGSTLRRNVKIPLRRTRSDMDGLTTLLASRLGSDLAERPIIESVEPSVISACTAQDLTFLVRGANIWRSTEAYFLGFKHKEVRVLPDMEGVALTFDLRTLPVRPATYAAPKLVLTTKNGAVEHVIKISGGKGKGDERCGTEAFAQANPPDTTQPTITSVMPDVLHACDKLPPLVITGHNLSDAPTLTFAGRALSLANMITVPAKDGGPATQVLELNFSSSSDVPLDNYGGTQKTLPIIAVSRTGVARGAITIDRNPDGCPGLGGGQAAAGAPISASAAPVGPVDVCADSSRVVLIGRNLHLLQAASLRGRNAHSINYSPQTRTAELLFGPTGTKDQEIPATSDLTLTIAGAVRPPVPVPVACAK